MKYILLVAFLVVVVKQFESSLLMSELELALTEEELDAHADVSKWVEAFIYGNTDADKPSRLYKFEFTQCYKPSESIVVMRDVTLRPDPLKLPGNVTASAGVLIKEPFGTPLHTVLKIEKKTKIGWIKVPCIVGVGSCTYDDLCEKVHPKTCPPIFEKIHLNCRCPWTAGNWTVPPTTMYIKEKIPFTGDLKIHAELSYHGKKVTCVDIYMTVAD